MITLTSFLISFCLCVLVLLISLPVSKKIGLVDKPGGVLKVHTEPVPIIGGIAIFFSIVFAVLITELVGTHPLPGNHIPFLVGGASICVIGLWDDVRHMSPFLRLLLELFIAALMVMAGYSVKLTEISWVCYLFSIFLLAGLINAVNMMDGMDGLAGGVSLLSAIGFSYVFYHIGARTPLFMSLALTGALAAFLLFNFYPAKVFLGDNGSYLLGFMAFIFSARLALQPQKIGRFAGVIFIIGLPVIDAGTTIVRRLLRRQSPFEGDRSHLYDLLFHRTGSQLKTVWICYAIQLMLIIMGILLVN